VRTAEYVCALRTASGSTTPKQLLAANKLRYYKEEFCCMNVHIICNGSWKFHKCHLVTSEIYINDVINACYRAMWIQRYTCTDRQSVVTDDFGTCCNLITRISAVQVVQERMVSSGMLRHVALVRTDVSEELSASFLRVMNRWTRNNASCN
jgi:hypothetical protein